MCEKNDCVAFVCLVCFYCYVMHCNQLYVRLLSIYLHNGRNYHRTRSVYVNTIYAREECCSRRAVHLFHHLFARPAYFLRICTLFVVLNLKYERINFCLRPK